jgi:hypothetical protein
MLAAALPRVALLLGLSLATPAGAASFCVETAAELRAALNAAQFNDEDDLIRLKVGTFYPASGGAVAPYQTVSERALTLRGGYSDVGNFPCAVLTGKPSDTLLAGGGERQGVQFVGTAGSIARLTVQNLTITSGEGGRGGNMAIGGEGFAGDVTIERIHFHNGNAAYGGALYVETSGTLTLRNSVFRDNRATGDVAAAVIAVQHAEASTPRVFIGGNTVVRNRCSSIAPPSCAVGGIALVGSARAAVYNNAFALGDGPDLVFDGTVVLLHNALDDYDGVPETARGNLIGVEPRFVDPGNYNFRIAYSSPLREAGTSEFDLGSLDADGKPRLHDERHDIGAYENGEYLFRDGFDDEA